MLTEQEADSLMTKLIELRAEVKVNKDPKVASELRRFEQTCIEKFKYLVTMKTSRYKAFSNYDDLNQEGFEALLKAMNNFNPKKGSFFWWAHKYIDTRISRSANLHTTIRYPLKVAKETTPHKEAIMPLLIEERYCPDREYEDMQTLHIISSAMDNLNEQQQQIVALAYGLEGDKPMSVNKICKQLSISRSTCQKALASAISILKDRIKL